MTKELLAKCNELNKSMDSLKDRIASINKAIRNIEQSKVKDITVNSYLEQYGTVTSLTVYRENYLEFLKSENKTLNDLLHDLETEFETL